MARKDPPEPSVQPDMTPTLERAAPPPDAMDADAFVAMLKEHDRLLRSLVYRMVGNRDLMDDVLQEVYLKAFRARASFRGESSPATWLYRIAYNACLDELRKNGRWQPAELDEAMPDPAPEPGEQVALRGDIAAALDALPVEQRAAILLVDLHGMDYAAAGAVLGAGAGTVGSRVSRGRAALRRILSEGNAR
ncbi:MAG TPA: RNA polymerase sigma factor [Frankiaceae bacterium]|nr:RNA polymerase sigma factor [Frankiaceae bacterium]